MNTFFLIDEQTDNEPLEVVQERCDMCVDAVMNPYKPRSRGENILGEVTRQYVETVIFGQHMRLRRLLRIQILGVRVQRHATSRRGAFSAHVAWVYRLDRSPSRESRPETHTPPR